MIQPDSSISDATLSANELADATIAGITPDEQASFDSLGAVPGNTLGAINASPAGQAVMDAVEQAIVLQVLQGSKRQSDHLTQTMAQARQDSQG